MKIFVPKTVHKQNKMQDIGRVTGSKNMGDTGLGLGNPNTKAEKKRNPPRGQVLKSFNVNR